MTALRPHRPVRLPAALAAMAMTIIGGGLAGCGQKGPLYLPGESAQQVQPGIPAGGADPTVPEEDDDEEEDAPAER